MGFAKSRDETLEDILRRERQAFVRVAVCGADVRDPSEQQCGGTDAVALAQTQSVCCLFEVSLRKRNVCVISANPLGFTLKCDARVERELAGQSGDCQLFFPLPHVNESTWRSGNIVTCSLL